MFPFLPPGGKRWPVFSLTEAGAGWTSQGFDPLVFHPEGLRPLPDPVKPVRQINQLKLFYQRLMGFLQSGVNGLDPFGGKINLDR